MKKIKHVEPVTGEPTQLIWAQVVNNFNKMVDQHNELVRDRVMDEVRRQGAAMAYTLGERMVAVEGKPQMRTKQETIDYCRSEINDAKRIRATERDVANGVVLEAIIKTYEDVIKFLEDETTETTLVG